MEVLIQADTKVATQADTELSVDTNVWFLGELGDPTLFIGYIDHVAFRLWHREI